MTGLRHAWLVAGLLAALPAGPAAAAGPHAAQAQTSPPISGTVSLTAGQQASPVEIANGPTGRPGIVLTDEAAGVNADAGPVASGVDFQVEVRRPSRVSGRLAASDRRRLLSGAVILTVRHDDRLSPLPVRDVTIRPDDTFEFREVPPGRYVILARGQTERDGMSLFGRFAIELSGRDVSNIDITLTPGARISGRVEFEGEPQPRREAIETLRVHAIAVDGVSFGDAYSDPVDAGGRFEFRGVMPGEHVLRLEGLPDGWSMRSVHLMGRAVTDTPLTLDGGQVLRNLQIVATDSETVVSGQIAGDDGRARPDAVVVAFPADPGLWVPFSRHVKRARPDLDGHYRIRGLPPGEYLIVATNEIDEADPLETETLERLRAPADRLTLAPGERKTVNLGAKNLRPDVGIDEWRPVPESAP